MSIDRVLTLLIQERDRLNKAIEALQGSGKSSGVSGGTRKPRTAAQRKAQSEKMKKYWASRRKQQGGAKSA